MSSYVMPEPSSCVQMSDVLSDEGVEDEDDEIDEETSEMSDTTSLFPSGALSVAAAATVLSGVFWAFEKDEKFSMERPMALARSSFRDQVWIGPVLGPGRGRKDAARLMTFSSVSLLREEIGSRAWENEHFLLVHLPKRW